MSSFLTPGISDFSKRKSSLSIKSTGGVPTNFSLSTGTSAFLGKPFFIL